MEMPTRFGMRLLLALFVLLGLSACALGGSSSEEAAAPTAVEQEDQLAGLEEPKPLDSQPIPLMAEDLEPKAEQKAEPLAAPTPAPAPTVSSPSVKKEKAPVKAVKAKAPTKAASKVADKGNKKDQGGFKTTAKACTMKSKPGAKASNLTEVPKGRKIWVEKVGAYYKVSRVKGVGYLPVSCF